VLSDARPLAERQRQLVCVTAHAIGLITKTFLAQQIGATTVRSVSQCEGSRIVLATQLSRGFNSDWASSPQYPWI
jgi:hypothetical protein